MGDRKRIQRRLRRARSADPEQYEKSVVTAAAEFGLDPKDPRDRERLLHILAHAIFAPGKKGRPRDSATAWSSSRLITLGGIYEKTKKKNPRLSDAKIAILLKSEHSEFKNDDAEQIRQRLRKAHWYYKTWEECRDDEPPDDWEPSEPDYDDYDD